MANHGGGHVNRKAYLIVFGVLALLTVLEVVAANPALGISRTAVGFLLVTMALSKAAIVGYYYMHLQHEKKALKLTVALPFAFPALYAVVLITEAMWRLAETRYLQ